MLATSWHVWWLRKRLPTISMRLGQKQDKKCVQEGDIFVKCRPTKTTNENSLPDQSLVSELLLPSLEQHLHILQAGLP